ncbi:MAG: MraY family glycosyltransferase [Parahaliea sp.]
MYTLPVFMSALIMSTLVLLVAKPLAVRVGLVDKPGGRKIHTHDVPLVGGTAIFLSIFLAWCLAPPLLVTTINSIFVAAGALLFFVGMIDDRLCLPVRTRFAAQIAAALLLMHSQVTLQDLGALWSSDPVALGWLATPLTILAVVGAINAVNMIDGIDGLAGTVTVVSFLLLLGVSFESERLLQILIILCLLGGLGAFLLFNMPIKGRDSAHIYMGDAGSTLLGFMMAYLLIDLSQGEKRAISPVTALWIFAVPLIDTLRVMLRRMLQHQSPFAADRGHIHHLLLDAGFRVRQTLYVIATVQLALGVFGLAGYYLGVHDGLMLALFLLFFAAYFVFANQPQRVVGQLRDWHQRVSWVARGVRYIYVGNLNFSSAVTEMKKLLRECDIDLPFGVYRAESDEGKHAGNAYALVDAGGPANIKKLIACLESGIARMHGENGANTCNIPVRQYIPRQEACERRQPRALSLGCENRKGERRVLRFRPYSRAHGSGTPEVEDKTMERARASAYREN